MKNSNRAAATRRHIWASCWQSAAGVTISAEVVQPDRADQNLTTRFAKQYAPVTVGGVETGQEATGLHRVVRRRF
jgi:hypothetical protein